MSGEAPSPEQIVAELQKARVDELLVHACSLIGSLGFGKLAPEARDLEQARLAVEALRALVPVLEGTVSAEVTRDLQQVVANLQLAYASAAAQPEQTAD